MTLLTSIPFTLDTARLMKKAHLPADVLDPQVIRELVQSAQMHGRPKALYKPGFGQERQPNAITFEGITFHSRALAENLKTIERGYVFVATCGTELDEVHVSNGDPLEDFLWDHIKAAALECALNELRRHLKKEAGWSRSSSMSPGSGDAEIWPIEQQTNLFKLLGDVRAHIGVTLTDSCLMIPNKSVSGILFPTTIDFQSCRLCHRADCPSRRTAYDPQLWHSLYEDETAVPQSDNR